MEIETAHAPPDAHGLTTLGAIDSITTGESSVEIAVGDATLRIDALSDAALRIRLRMPGGEWAPDGSYALDPDAVWPGPTQWTASLTDDALRVETGKLIVTSDREACRLRIETADGRVLVDETGGVAWDGDCWAHSVALDPDDRLLGLGDKALTVDRRGHRVEMWNTDAYQYGRGTDPLYKSVPFVLHLGAVRAVGLFYDGARRTAHDLGAHDASTMRADGTGPLDLYVLAPEPSDDPATTEAIGVVQQFAALTGRTPMLPRWALGYHQCRYSYLNEGEVREVAREFRERGIPCDTLYFDIHYMDGYRVFTWDPDAFPDPRKLLADLRDDGFTSVVIVDPGVKADDPNYDVYTQGVDLDAYVRYPDHDTEDDQPGDLALGHVWPGLCAFPDFTRADVRTWWGDLHAGLLADGVDGIWNDMNEPAVFEVEHVDGSMDSEGSAGTLPDDVRFALDSHGGGGSHLDAHNVYGMQMQRATFDGLKRAAPTKRPFTITRAAYAGAQRFGTGWTGDNSATWDHLKLAVSTVLSLGVSGMPFTGADVGGFSGTPSGELMARWTQVGALTPLFRNHSAIDTPRQEPWLFGDEVERVCREAIELRYRLLPVFYTALHQAATDGTPILRALSLVHPTDETVRHTSPLGFYVGDALLAQPVFEEGQTEREVYLPESPGGWLDIATGERFPGRTTVWTETPLDRVPLYLRGGHVLPLAPVRQHTGEAVGHLELLVAVAPGSHVSRLYDDSGDGWSFQDGDGWDGRLVLEADSESVTLTTTADGTFTPAWTRWDLVLHGLNHAPSQVTADGETVDADWADGVLRLSVTPGARVEVVR